MKLLPEPGFSLVQKYLGIFQISKPTYYRGVKAGTQPRAIPITEGRVAIPNCEINKHILKLLEAASEAEEARKQLQMEAEAKEQDEAPEQHDEEDEAEDAVA
jgi:predicted DNA-binding transcriptional regulator AlpA